MAEECLEVALANGLKAYLRGPSFNAGPLPTLVYFSLSGYESLTLEPYSQPVDHWLAHGGVRALSFDLPGHLRGGRHEKAMEAWAYRMGVEGRPLLSDFLAEVRFALQELIAAGWIAPGQLFAAGLSRGALLATFLATDLPKIAAVVGFAPLTRLDLIQEFQPYRHLPHIESMALIKHASALVGCKLCLYIGNRDLRVGTRAAFELVEQLVEASVQTGVRHPAVELRIYPSIGHKGHGTPPAIFKSGADWLISNL